MSIATTDNKVTYQGNGATYSWPFSFPVLDASHLQVILTDASGTETTISSDYTVNLTSKTVKYPGYLEGQEPPVLSQPPLLPTGWKITLLRVVPYTQETDFGERWPFSTIEATMDCMQMQIQQLAEEVGRSVKVGVTSSATPDELIASLRESAAASISASATAVTAADTATSAQAACSAAKTVCEAKASASTTAQAVCESAASSVSSATQTATDAAATAVSAANTAQTAAGTATTKASDAQTAASGASASATTASDKLAGLQNLLNGSTVAVPAMPVGVPFPWFKSTYPTGTLLCNGQTFSATTYPELAAVYPSLTLPDIRGVVPRGLDHGRGLDVDGASRALGSYQADQYKSHTHAYDMDYGAGNTWRFTNNSGEDAYYASGPTGTSGGTETRMKNIACDWLVYAVSPTVAIV